MPRGARNTPGGWIYHVLNRATCDQKLFYTAACYREFLGIIAVAAALTDMRILAFCAMPNHWHFLLWPKQDGDLARFVHRFAMQHARRWHESRGTRGRGHLYQSRYKSFPVRDDWHLLTVARYVERNPVRAGVARRARDWPWSSAASRTTIGCGEIAKEAKGAVPLTAFPVDAPVDWERFVDEPQTYGELKRLRLSIRHGAPFGDAEWQEHATSSLELAPLPRRACRLRSPLPY